ncbi:MAG: threonylcarbamoyl-AMP synthase [Actinobacteria bacterium]|nr:threonylcarbamoyl-AMP synthase [Actinomycetota bacterium]
MSTVRTLDDRAAVVSEVISTLRAAELVVVPTDTVYGVIADAFDPDATAALRTAKQLAPTAPLTVLLRNPRQVVGVASEIPEAADRLMASYWPGPLTIVLPATDGLTWDIGTPSVVALRMPTDDLLLEVIADIGPLVCSAAARPVDPLPHHVEDARASLGDAVALYVDGGPRPAPVSTIVDLTGRHADVLREGAIPAADVELVAAGRVGWGTTPD